MGNYVSCAPTALLQCKHCQMTKVILPTGELRQFDGPVYAAELMVDAPNHFLVNTRSMQVGRRFSPLPADEELEAGGVYAMFPMKWANLVVTAADLAAPLVAAASAAGRRLNGRVRIQPETVQASPAEACDSVEIRPESEAAPWPRLDGFRANKLCTCRSRKPSLETINEEAISSVMCRSPERRRVAAPEMTATGDRASSGGDKLSPVSHGQGKDPRTELSPGPEWSHPSFLLYCCHSMTKLKI